MPQGLAQTTPHRPGVHAGAAYDGAPGTIAAARRFAAGFIGRLRDEAGAPVTDESADTVRLVVSELVTNAIRYAPGPCLIDLELRGRQLRITLWDTEPHAPVPQAADPARIGGHGLEIVLALCSRFEVRQQAGGKRVQVDLDLDLDLDRA
jgi:anti-sigma regulatory factor (Ser/Thr protein kinase)